MSRDVCKVDPAIIQWKVSRDLLRDPLDHDGWSTLERFAIRDTEKHRAIVARFVDGQPRESTPLFRDLYTRRLRAGEVVRGCTTMDALVGHYRGRMEATYADMRAHGFRRQVEGRPTLPIPVYVAKDGEILLGNQGNHRLAMAQVLALPYVIVDVVGRHPDSRAALDPLPADSDDPDLPLCARHIPAMTTDAERRCYYRHTKAAAGLGAIVELGAWLGASTAYIAAGVRDSGVPTKAYVFDRFLWDTANHDRKAGGQIPEGRNQLAGFKANLGPLLEFVKPKAMELKSLAWPAEKSVAFLVCDAPKRIPEIAHTLTTFGPALHPGALMAWQDFGYFPSYDIPAAIMRLGDRLEFVEGVYPGTTAVFRVRKAWSAGDVSPTALDLGRWKVEEVEAAWTTWGAKLPAPMRPRFACGAALFLCDLRANDRARAWLRTILAAHPDEVLPKWKYLAEERAALMTRYRPLLEEVAKCA